MSDTHKVLVLRDDLAHPYISGNKSRKLKYNLPAFINSGAEVMLTFGGAFSNHLVAVAAAGKENGFSTVGIVRGEDVGNPYTDFMRSCGMHLHFVSRTEYKDRNSPAYINRLISQLHAQGILPSREKVFVLPEGGANMEAARGCRQIAADLHEADLIFCAYGTGTTVAGISAGLLPHQEVHAIPVLTYFDPEDIRHFGGRPERVRFHGDYHFGGYAKAPVELKAFCASFIQRTGIPVEPVYTGKVFFAVSDLLEKGILPPGKTIGIVHTGGIFNFNSEKFADAGVSKF